MSNSLEGDHYSGFCFGAIEKKGKEGGGGREENGDGRGGGGRRQGEERGKGEERS